MSELTDKDKLDYIEKIARDAFGPHLRGKPLHQIESYRTQALANIFAVFEYNGALIPRKPEEPKEEDDTQITFDDLLEGGEP